MAVRARFGVPSDVYALGATLYHLLTGEIPIQATDRASGVELPEPHRLNPKVSSHVSIAVLSAMEIRVDRRPQSVRDFLTALRGVRPSPPIVPNDDRAAPTGANAERQNGNEMGCVAIKVDRIGIGRLPIDREVTINVAKAVHPSSGRFLIDKSITLSNQAHSWKIDLVPGEYRIWATCAMTVKGIAVFATRQLESNECNLVVPSGSQPANLTLERLSDGLHLTADKASDEPTRGKIRNGTSQQGSQRMGVVTIKRIGSFPVDCPVTITVARVGDGYDQTYAKKIMSNTQQTIEIELQSGEYEVSATCRFRDLVVHGDSSVARDKEETTNKCKVVVKKDRRVALNLDRLFDDLYLFKS